MGTLGLLGTEYKPLTERLSPAIRQPSKAQFFEMRTTLPNILEEKEERLFKYPTKFVES